MGHRLVVLLRGINVGRAKQVGMADLKVLLEAGGYQDVRTHLRSGNVVVGTTRAANDVAGDVEQRLAERFGFPVGVVVRTAGELAATVAADPFGAAAGDPARRMVAFLAGEPDTDGLAVLRAATADPERLAVHGRDLHLWLPGGVADSPLAKLLTPARLGTTVTVRNWNTVTRLLTLAGPGA